MKNLIKLRNLMKNNKEIMWGIGEFAIILIAWFYSQNLILVFSIKLFSILFSEEIFHEEIAVTVKRMLWQTIVFIGFVISFALNHTGHLAYGLMLTCYIILAGLYLLKTGKFHKYKLN